VEEGGQSTRSAPLSLKKDKSQQRPRRKNLQQKKKKTEELQKQAASDARPP
jgi:ribosomal protein S30